MPLKIFLLFLALVSSFATNYGMEPQEIRSAHPQPQQPSVPSLVSAFDQHDASNQHPLGHKDTLPKYPEMRQEILEGAPYQTSIRALYYCSTLFNGVIMSL